MRVMREVRCFPARSASAVGLGNSFAGSIGRDGFEMFWTVRAVVEGAVDPVTGYLCNIKALDAVLREVVVARLGAAASAVTGAVVEEDLAGHEGAQRRVAAGPLPHGRGSECGGLAAALRAALPEAARQCPARTRLVSLELAVSPFLRFTVLQGAAAMVRVTHTFEFSAAHRLYCPQLSEDENRATFGKCSNPHGHGHNYILEVVVAGDPDDHGGTVVDMERFDRTVKERVIDRFDHKHLNLDCQEFRTLNPSVENIARVIWQRLVGGFAPGRLACVRVWETPKTYAEYAGEEGNEGVRE